MKQVLRFCLIIILAASPLWATFQDHTGTTSAIMAETYYQNKEYNNALSIYKPLLIQHPKNPDLLYNIGNTYYQLEKIGYAIAFYKKALQYTPRDRYLKENLALAQSKVLDEIPHQPSIVSTLQNASEILILTEYITLFLCLLLAHSLLWWAWKNRIKTVPMKITFIVTWSLMGLLGLGFIALESQQLKSNTAIIIKAKTELKSGPSQSLETTLVVHEGIECKILQNSQSWTYIQLKNNFTGWVPKQDLLPLY